MYVRGFALVLAAGMAGAASSPAPVPSVAIFAPLLGSWRCDGSFSSTGKALAATIRFESDLAGAAVVQHHDDLQPGPYHALEVWEYDSGSANFDATIVDNFGGTRAFSSDGWHDASLIWASGPGVKPAQQFVYTQLPGGGLRVDWRVSRDGTSYVLGDTLGCVKS